MLSERASVLLRAVALLVVAGLLVPGVTYAQGGPVVDEVRADVTAIDEGDAVTLEAIVTHPDGAPLRYGWDFGDGTVLDLDPAARRTFAVYLDDGTFEAVVTAEDPQGRQASGRATITVRNVAPEIDGIDRDGEALEGNEVLFRARASDPGSDDLSYSWDFGDGTVVGPRASLVETRHAFEEEGSYVLRLTVEDGDGGISTFQETVVVGAGFRFRASGAISVSDGDGESPYLMGMPIVYDGQRVRFAGDLGAATRGDPAADAGAQCYVSFGSRSPTIASGTEPGTIVRFGGVFPNGLREGTYPVAVVRNELPFTVYEVLEREYAEPETFFAYVETMELEDGVPSGESFHGAGGSVTIQRWENGRVELTFSANLEETLGALDLLDTPGPPQLRPALMAQVSGSFAHELRRSLLGGSGSLNALSGSSYGDWYLCAPRDPLAVDEVVPAPEAATRGGGTRDVPLVDFQDPELTVRFSRPVDQGSAVENVVLEWRRANGDFEEVPIAVLGEDDDTLRLLPLDDLMDGVVYRARIVGGTEGIQGADGEVLQEDEVWLFETIIDLSEDRNGVTLATTQVARDASLVAGKPTETRVYLNWREKPHVHPEWQTRYATYVVEVEGGDYPAQRVRVKRADLYGPVEKKYALDSVNFYGWEPDGSSTHTLVARATQQGQVEAERGFEGTWTVDGYGTVPGLVFDYHFVQVGSWADGVPLDARRLGHRIAQLGATFTEQTFPVPDVVARSRGDVFVPEPDEPIVEAMGQEFYLSSLLTATRRDEDLVEAYARRIGATSADVVLAFLPPDVLNLSGFAYQALGTDPRVVAVAVDPSLAQAEGYFASTVAHEIGHTYGLEHNSRCPSDAIQACVDLGRSDAVEGTRVASDGSGGANKSGWNGNADVGRTPGVVLSLMHPSNLPDASVFITNEDYLRLQDALRSRGAVVPGRWPALQAVQATRVLGVRVAGAVDLSQDAAVVSSLVPVTTARREAAPAPDDGLRFEARAADGTVRSSVGVSLIQPDRWHAPDAPETVRPFDVFVPTTADVTSIVLLQGDRVLAERRASASVPELDSDASELQVMAPIELRWRAFDADGDTLRFDVEYAPDGVDWRPLAFGLRSPSLRLDPDVLPAGPRPTVRIVARDGFHAAALEVGLTLPSEIRVLATDPAPEAHASPGTSITVWTLDELTGFGPDDLRVVRDDGPEAGTPVPGRLEMLFAGVGLRFIPDAPLAAEARYRAIYEPSAGGTSEAAADWTFATGEALPERTIRPRTLSDGPLASAAETSSANDAASTALPETCAGIARDVFAPLVPAGASLEEAGEVDGSCRIVATLPTPLGEVRSFVERAILTNRLFLTANRVEDGGVFVGARGSEFEAEARMEEGPPTQLTWILRPTD